MYTRLQLTWEFADKRSLESGSPQLHQIMLVFGGFSHISQKTFKYQDNHKYKHQLHSLHNIT